MAESSDMTELLDRVRLGDQTAKGELLGRLRPRLCRMVAVRMDDRVTLRVDPSDVVQEALVVADRRLPEYFERGERGDTPFYPWLRKIALERLVEAHREHVLADKRSVRREVPMRLSEASSICLAKRMAANGSSPSGHFARKELQARIRSILSELADSDREILVLKHLEELSNAECASVQGITIVAVKKRYLRALVRVRSLMDREI